MVCTRPGWVTTTKNTLWKSAILRADALAKWCNFRLRHPPPKVHIGPLVCLNMDLQTCMSLSWDEETENNELATSDNDNRPTTTLYNAVSPKTDDLAAFAITPTCTFLDKIVKQVSGVISQVPVWEGDLRRPTRTHPMDGLYGAPCFRPSMLLDCVLMCLCLNCVGIDYHSILWCIIHLQALWTK